MKNSVNNYSAQKVKVLSAKKKKKLFSHQGGIRKIQAKEIFLAKAFFCLYIVNMGVGGGKKGVGVWV